MNKRIIAFMVSIASLCLGASLFYQQYHDVSSPYVDTAAQFSIQLPRNWVVRDSVYATTTSTVRFSASQKSRGVGDDSVRIVVTRFEKTPAVSIAMKEYLEEGFLQQIVNDVKLGLNKYTETSNGTTTIQGVLYHRIVGSYVGIQSQKRVIQELYITLTPEAYYLVGVDVYADLWDENKRSVLDAINTLTLL